jgi:hypothetical protein
VLAIIAFANAGSKLEDATVPVPLTGTTVEPVRVATAAAVKQPAPPPAPSTQLLFVFRAGGATYMKLSDDEPAHGKRRMVEDDDGASTIAEVRAAALPKRFRGWETKQFTVDGGCTATVAGFAVVTRLVGDPGYVGLEAEKWTVETAADAGTKMLAARLDVPESCAKGLYARDASLAPIVTMETLDDADLASTARSALLATETAQAAQASWSEYQSRDEGAEADDWSEHAEFATHVVRHPRTGVTWVAIHASAEHGCGGPDINVWGLFRVARDGSLVTVFDRKLETLYAIDRILDVDNDGKLELLGKDWLGLQTILARANGDEVSRLEMQFHGCPC